MRTASHSAAQLLCWAAFGALVGCGGGTSDGDPSGGSTSGGANSTAGNPASSAGTSPSGGTPSNGGTTAMAGMAGMSAGGSNGGTGQGGQSGGGAMSMAGSGGSTAGNGGSAGSGGAQTGMLSVTPAEWAVSYPRTTGGPTRTFEIRNTSSSSLSVNLSIAGTHPTAFQITTPATPTAMIPAGMTLSVAVQFTPSRLATTGMTAAPVPDNGGVAVNAVLSVTSGSGMTQAALYGLAITATGSGAGSEATLGQILQTLGYNVDVGAGLRDHLMNTLNPMPAQGTEVFVPRFVKAGTGSVTLKPIARFSPAGPMPYGYYTVAAPACATTAANCPRVGTMTAADETTASLMSSRMINSPTDAMGAMGTFDPGTASFGIWAYTDQASQRVSTGGTATNGDYAFTEDGLNVPMSRHRVRVWPLRDRAGAAIANSYLLGVEEASNGDYQDYLFILSNVKPP